MQAMEGRQLRALVPFDHLLGDPQQTTRISTPWKLIAAPGVQDRVAVVVGTTMCARSS
jgi:hypothetical protein